MSNNGERKIAYSIGPKIKPRTLISNGVLACLVTIEK